MVEVEVRQEHAVDGRQGADDGFDAALEGPGVPGHPGIDQRDRVAVDEIRVDTLAVKPPHVLGEARDHTRRSGYSDKSTDTPGPLTSASLSNRLKNDIATDSNRLDMDDRWRYVFMSLVLVSLVSVGVAEGYTWYRTDQTTSSGGLSSCESGHLRVINYTGSSVPDSVQYDNLTAEQQRAFDRVRTADEERKAVDPDVALNFSSISYVVYQNETYFLTQSISECGDDTDGEPPGWVRTVLTPFFLIDAVVGRL